MVQSLHSAVQLGTEPMIAGLVDELVDELVVVGLVVGLETGVQYFLDIEA